MSGVRLPSPPPEMQRSYLPAVLGDRGANFLCFLGTRAVQRAVSFCSTDTAETPPEPCRARPVPSVRGTKTPPCGSEVWRKCGGFCASQHERAEPRAPEQGKCRQRPQEARADAVCPCRCLGIVSCGERAASAALWPCFPAKRQESGFHACRSPESQLLPL